MPNQKHSVIAK